MLLKVIGRKGGSKGLVTNYWGGATKREWGHVKFYTYEKGGKSFSHPEWGGGPKTFWFFFFG